MKKNCYCLFILFLFLFIPISASADEKKELFKCEYDVMIIPAQNDKKPITFPLTTIVYNDNTAKFINAEHEMKSGTNSNIYLDKDNTWGAVTIDINTQDYAKKATALGKYSCPTLTLDISRQTDYSLLNEDRGNASNGGGYWYVTAGGTPILENNSQNNDNVKKVTASCTRKVTSIDSIKFNPTITFKMFNTGQKQYCLTIDNYNESCAYVTPGTSSLYFSEIDHYIFYITGEQSSKIFKQGNMAMINNNAFVCPDKIYIYYDVSSTGDIHNYYFTTDEKEALANSRENQHQELNKPNGDENGNINNGEPLYRCDKIIPLEIRNWINGALNLLKYIALVLVIVLGVTDFIKAAASGEADQMKKSGQSFLKRIIAVIILFLLPMLVELILNLIDIYGADSTCLPQ